MEVLKVGIKLKELKREEIKNLIIKYEMELQENVIIEKDLIILSNLLKLYTLLGDEKNIEKVKNEYNKTIDILFEE